MKGPGLRGNVACTLALCCGLTVGDTDGLNILGEKKLSGATRCTNAPTILLLSSRQRSRKCLREMDPT